MFKLQFNLQQKVGKPYIFDCLLCFRNILCVKGCQFNSDFEFVPRVKL